MYKQNVSSQEKAERSSPPSRARACEDGKPRVNLTAAEKARIFAWIDLNIPYYGSPDTENINAHGAHKVDVKELAPVLAEVSKRRCAECHKGKLPPGRLLRFTNPENNSSPLAPLAKATGGTEACGKVVFKDKNDPDYQKILDAFEPTLEMLKANPRMDRPGSRPVTDQGRCRI